MKRKYHVTLDEGEWAYIGRVLNATDTPSSIRKRCQVLQMADENVGQPPKQEEIAKRCGVSKVTVYTVIRDYASKGTEYCLRRLKRATSPRPPIVTGEREARIVSLACSEPPAGYARWTVRLLTEKVIELEILPSVGRETIRTTLKKHDLSLT